MGAGGTVAAIRTDLLSVPLAFPLREHPFLGQRTQFATLLVRVRSKEGAEGFGYVTAESTAQMAAVERIVESLEPVIVGSAVAYRARTFRRMWQLTAELLHEGAANLAIAAVDTALWDLAGKIAGQPLAALIGAHHDAVPIYASHGLWRHCTLDEIAADGQRLVKEGFTAMKLRIKGESITEDIARVEALRAAVGPDIAILTDALWSMPPARAVRLSRAMAEHDVVWLEDPVAEDDPAGLARVARAEGTPIATGERISRLTTLQGLLDSADIDHLILDLHHLGGITPWLQAAALAEARAIPVSAHIAYEVQQPLLASCLRPGYLEYLPFWDVLYQEPPRPTHGMLATSDRPGLGLDLDEAAIGRLRVRAAA
ncbi:MAG: mandelate racemase/muconate lactonizing enzyme family protein [Azospirillaceae bacterium]